MSSNGTQRSTSCLICAHPLERVLSFGRMPIANGFLAPTGFATEFFFELELAFCSSCGMAQLGTLVDREKLFHVKVKAWMLAS